MELHPELVQCAQKEVGPDIEVDGIINMYSLQFICVSERLAAMLGYKHEELRDMSVRKILDISPQMLLEAVTEALGQAKEDTQTLIKKDGTKARGSASLRSFTYDGEPHLAIYNAHFHDVE